jgi:predicted transcriptional regulator
MANSNYIRSQNRLADSTGATYVLACLHRELTEQEIIKELNGNSKLIEIAIKFLLDMGWVTKDKGTEKWMITDLGRLELAEKQVLGS